MGITEMVVLIVFIGCVTGIVKSFIERRSDGGRRSASALAEQEERLASLEERVGVLEAVVTDSRYELKREIDNL